MRLQITLSVVLGSLLSLVMGTPDFQLISASALRSSPITITSDGQQLAVVNPDSNSFSLVNLASLTLLLEIPVGPNPQTVTIEPSGRWAFVSNRDNDTISMVDLVAEELITHLSVEDEPFGVGSVDRMDRFLVPIESDDSLEVQTGVTSANPISLPVEITLTLRDADGIAVPEGSVVLSLPAHGQLARFPGANLRGEEHRLFRFPGDSGGERLGARSRDRCSRESRRICHAARDKNELTPA